MKITYDIDELRKRINALYSPCKIGVDEVVSREDVLSVLFGDIQEKMR